jgi:pimeloyl-ACP methyl ester carboxylesterase
MWAVHLTLGLAGLYVTAVLTGCLAQTRLLFPTHLAAASRPTLPSGAERLELVVPEGERLVGVRLPAAGSARNPPLLFGFGGNAWNAENVALYLQALFPSCEVVAFHYRGYSPSGGQPSAAALLSDSLAIFDDLHNGREGRPVVAIGFSIGSAVAAFLARHRPLAGMILVTPFDSLEALAREHFAWAPVGMLLRHHMPTLELAREAPLPTALIVAGRDTMVPARRSAPLRKAIPNLVLDRTIADAGHNDLYDHPAFIESMREALDRIGSASATFATPC